jgi:hypothetical protein
VIVFNCFFAGFFFETHRHIGESEEYIAMFPMASYVSMCFKKKSRTGPNPA